MVRSQVLARSPQYFNRYFSHPDPSMEMSVHKSLQTLFYPTKGIHRGLAKGLETSAITYMQGSVEVSTTSVNNVLTFSFQPILVFSQGLSTSGRFGSYVAAPTMTDPETGTGAVAIPGPMFGSPAGVSSRTVSFTLNIIPASTVLNRGGEGKLAYASAFNSLSFTRSNIDNLMISRAWDGVESMSIHWAPSIAEQEFDLWDSGDAYTDNIKDISGVLGYLVVPLGVVSTWRFEWAVGVEYIPSDQYRPFVDRKAPTIHPDTPYYINQVIQKHWTPLMISSYKDYEERLSAATTLGGLTDLQYHDHAGLAGPGFMNPASVEGGALGIWEDGFEDMEGNGSLGNQIINSLTKGACNIAEGFTGEDICAQPGVALGRLASRGIRNMFRNPGTQMGVPR